LQSETFQKLNTCCLVFGGPRTLKTPKKTISLLWLFDGAWSNDEELHQYALKVYDKVDQCKAFFAEHQCNNVDADIAEYASSASIRIK